MRVLSLVAVAAIVLAWVVQLAAVHHRRSALADFGGRGEGLVVVAQRFQTDLAGAHSDVSNAFLAGGVEPPALIRAYRQGVAAAADDGAAAQAGATTGSHATLDTLAEQLPVYTGLVERARADNRQGYPIGAAYLRSAAALLQQQLLPAASGVASAGATRLNRSQRRATSVADVLVVLLTGLPALAALIGLQVFVTSRTRRAVNLGAAAATIVSVVALALVLSGMGAERAAAARAGRHAYASVARLAQARVLAFEAKADESQALIALGSGQSYEHDFDTDVAATSVLLDGAAAASTAPAAGAAIADGALPALRRFVSLDATIRRQDASGRHGDAVGIAIGTGPGSVNPVFASLDAELTTAQSAEQAAFVASVASGRRRLSALPVIATGAAALAALLALGGVQPRIGEYR
jgi:hypothetical protein